MLEIGRSTAVQVSLLVDLAEDVEFEDILASHLEELQRQTRELRDVVLELLKKSRASFENPLDFLTSQELNATASSVNESIEKVLTAFESLKDELPDSDDQQDSEDVPDEKAYDAAMRSGKRYGVKLANLVHAVLEKLDEDALTDTMRDCVLELKLLLEYLEGVKMENGDRLMRMTQSVLELARVVGGLDSDIASSTSLASFRERVKALSDEIKSVVRSLQSKIERMNRAKDEQEKEPSQMATYATIEAVIAGSDGVAREWDMLPTDLQKKVEAEVERIITEYARKNYEQLEFKRSEDEKMKSEEERKIQEAKKQAVSELRKDISNIKLPPTPNLNLKSVAELRSTVGSLATLRGRSHTSTSAIMRAPKGLRENSKERTAKQKLEMFSGVSSLNEWEALLAGTDSTIHMGGIVGDVKVTRTNRSFDSLSKVHFESLAKHIISYILSSNASVISKTTTRETVETAASAVLKDIKSAMLSVYEQRDPTVLEQAQGLLLVVCAKADQLDLKAIVPDDFVVKDASTQSFSNLLRQLHVTSNAIKSLGVTLTTTLQAIDSKLNSSKSADKASAFSLSIVIQASAAANVLIDSLKELHSIVVTARKISTLTLQSAQTTTSLDQSVDGGLDFWMESQMLQGVSKVSREKRISLDGRSSDKDNSSNGGSAKGKFFPLSSLSSFSNLEQTKGTSKRNSASDISSRSLGNSSNVTGPDSSAAQASGQMIIPSLPVHGTLNMLIGAITHETLYDHRYMAAFIATYHSFTTAHMLLQKLLQRYDVPSNVDSNLKASIQFRVAVVMKYWIEKQPDDFDDYMMNQVDAFASGPLKEDHEKLAVLLLNESERQKRIKKNRKAVFESPPTNLQPVYGIFNAGELILQMSSEEIAKQLTIIDQAIYCCIQPSELLGQAWSKPKTRHKAQNVFALVTRLNRISYWIPTLVLAQDSDEARGSAIEKFILIAKHLRSFNNFHTLMGVIAGLNMAAVSRTRLKKCWSLVDHDLVSMFMGLETTMSPGSSYKNYRHALRSAKLPAIPFMGCYLGDLTFLDEGNPDEIDGLINFDKRLDLFKMIKEVESFSKSLYSWPQVEPLHTLLTAFPEFGDKDLYNISLCIEPRAPK